MEKKYILTDETITINDSIVLHRIKAIRSFNRVNVGDLGGWIEKEDNLSHEGDCWVCDNAIVYNNAKVYDNAIVYCHAKVSSNACVYGNAKVYDNAIVCGNAKVSDNAEVFGNAEINENANVYGNAYVYGNAEVFENAKVYGNAEVFENALIFGDVEVYGQPEISDNAGVFNNVKLYKNLRVFGDAIVCGNAIIQSNNDYIVFKNWWSSGRYFTWTRSNNMWCVGCFYGTGEDLIKKAYEDSEIIGREYERIVKYVESILKEEEKYV